MGTELARGRAPAAAAHKRAVADSPAGRRSALRPAPVGGLTVGHVEDPAERAADAAADVALARLRRVTHSADPAPRAHRHDCACGHLSRAWSPAPSVTPQVGAAGGTLDAETSTRIAGQVGRGAPLPGAVRERMETAFGTSLGHVRVHADPEAARLSAAVSAVAFTTGRDIFFGAGGFDPSDASGERVLAHEIAHVIQGPQPIRRLPVKDTTIDGVPLVAEVGIDFSANHMAKDLESAKTLSKSEARLARTPKNTVVIGDVGAVRTALANAEYASPGPIPVPGLTWVKITNRPTRALKPEQVTSQDVLNGTDPIKVKVRLVEDDETKLTTSPKSNPKGPILLATGVQG